MSDDHNEMLALLLANIWTGFFLVLPGLLKVYVGVLAGILWLLWVLTLWSQGAKARRR